MDTRQVLNWTEENIKKYEVVALMCDAERQVKTMEQTYFSKAEVL
jgi:hypothetical protein